MANVKQTQKMIPFITCEISLGQYVCELDFGVNVFDLDFGIQIDSIEQPIKRNSVGSVEEFFSARVPNSSAEVRGLVIHVIQEVESVRR